MTLFETALKTLGLNKLPSKKELKKAYNKKVKETHPDVSGGNGVEFVKINDCYKYLSSKYIDKYVINYGIDDILDNKKFKIKDLVSIHLTPKNIKNGNIRFNIDDKKISVKLNYKNKDKKTYPITVENGKVYINIDKQVSIDEFCKNKAIFYIGTQMLLATAIPNKDKLEVVKKLRKNFYLKIHFEIYRPTSNDDFRITSEDMKSITYINTRSF